MECEEKTAGNFLECFEDISSAVIRGKSLTGGNQGGGGPRIQDAAGLEIYRLPRAHSSGPRATNLSRLKGEMFQQGV